MHSSDEVLLEALALVQQHGAVRAAAKATGISRSTIRDRLRAAAVRGLTGGPPIPEAGRPPEGFIVRRNSAQYDSEGNLERQWVETGQGNTDGWQVPAGHVIKGESAFLDANGNVIGKWVKTREGSGSGLLDGLKTAFAEYDGAAPIIPAPAWVNDDLLTIYPVPDLHLGMHAWGRETGDNYDVKLATNLAVQSVSKLVAQSWSSKKAVVLVLGDYFHNNDAKNVTPGSGHLLDVDGRWPKVYAAGARLATVLVDVVARKHEEVEVVFLPGNHDPDAAITLTVALALFYSANERITVHQEPGIAWYRRFGKCLLGATHGHTMKPDRMAMMLATDRSEDWGQTVHRHMFFGHIHHESAKEVGPVRIESFSSPAARDGWNAASGFRSGRALSALTFHCEDGEIGRHRVNILRTDQV
jgi:hypothetical protein